MKAPDEPRDVFPAQPQGWQADEEDAEAVIEILAKATSLDRCLEVAVRGRDDTDIDPPGV